MTSEKQITREEKEFLSRRKQPRGRRITVRRYDASDPQLKFLLQQSHVSERIIGVFFEYDETENGRHLKSVELKIEVE